MNILLSKNSIIDDNHNYIFVHHPHGLFGVSTWCNFSTDLSKVKTLFPKIDFRLTTLNINFYIPYWRELLINRGFISADYNSCLYWLKKKKGNAINLVVGGAKESFYASPGSNSIFLNKRKGFIKLALQSGSSLVPVYQFGENSLYNQIQFKKNSSSSNVLEI
jgi:2-acylglycerol O-acyltransferase 2